VLRQNLMKVLKQQFTVMLDAPSDNPQLSKYTFNPLELTFKVMN